MQYVKASSNLFTTIWRRLRSVFSTRSVTYPLQPAIYPDLIEPRMKARPSAIGAGPVISRKVGPTTKSAK
jgi:hypothetical protein